MTDAHLPAPLNTSDCDLRGLPYMPLKVLNLRESDLVALSNGDEFKAAVMLWATAWNEVPAGSLMNNDRWLAGKAKVDLTTWSAIKAMALHGWVACSDGRLYHPVIIELAREALPGHKAYRDQRDQSVTRKQRERAERARLFERAKELGLPVTYQTKTGDLRAMVNAAENRSENNSRDLSRVTSHDNRRDPSHKNGAEERDQSRGNGVTSPVTSGVTVTAIKEKEKIESPQPPLGGVRDEFDEAWETIPEKCRAPADKDKARKAWDAIVASGEASASQLLAAVRMMAQAVGRSAGAMPVKAFHRWLEVGRWRNWPCEAASPSTTAWSGPADVRAAIIAHVAEARGSRKDAEDWAASWLDASTTWSEVPPAIVCLARTVERRLRETIGSLLAKLGVGLILKAAGEAA